MLSSYIKSAAAGPVHTGMQYLDFMRLLNEALAPASYFEIGTSEGHSLQAFTCDALCVDPKFRVNAPVFHDRARTLFFQMTSDQFFKSYDIRDHFPQGPDVCFLDGMHKFEFLLRDFIHTERSCHPNSLILLHDCLPLNERMTERTMRLDDAEDVSTRYAWTGDVWRILPTLKKYRPELRVLLLDCGPTGLVACSGLDPRSIVLRENYNAAVDEMTSLPLSKFGLEQLWTLYPRIDTARLAANPPDVSAIFNVY